jgi:hypothetical protein
VRVSIRNVPQRAELLHLGDESAQIGIHKRRPLQQ